MDYCVYITTYLGDKLPSKYIGSSSVDRVVKGYRGSVKSRKWKKIWKDELRDNPELFSTEIRSYHTTKTEAVCEELKLQLELSVVTSTDWINESYAKVNGFFGRDVSGNLNPNYGNGDAIKNWVERNPEKASERNRKAALTQWSNPETAANRIRAMQGKKRSRKTLTQEEFVELQKEKAAKAAEKLKCELEYNGKVYFGWNSLQKETGVTKHLYNKYYLNGIDPTLRIGTNGPVSKP
jgi:translation initiation factor 1 (eIF-1/SUI1)